MERLLAKLRILGRRPSRSIEVEITGGGRMLVDPSDLTGRMLAGSGVWEPHVTAVFRALLRPGDVCVDVGASIGYFTLLASRLVGPAGHVYAFEPAPDGYAALLENLRRNGIANVTAHAMAAGAAERVETLYDPWAPSNVGSASMRHRAHGPGGRKPIEVPVRPLKDLVPQADLARARLIKIDVEGYEGEVLDGLGPVYETGAGPALVVEVHPTLAADASARVAEFCARHRLTAQLIVDRPAKSRTWAAGHPELADLATPTELLSLEQPRFEVLLRPAS